MRHAIATPRYVTQATWLAVTGLVLVVGAVAASGLMGAPAGRDDDTAVQRAVRIPVRSLARVDDGSSRTTLRAGRVLSPSEVPDGDALGGPAPAARVALDQGYVGFEPTSIRLPSGRSAPVQPARVHSDGVLDVPQDPDRVGWWTGGAQAGEPYGSVVLAGHVDSADYGVGVLAEMIDMRPGQLLKIADGRHGQVYRVQTIRKQPKTTLSAGTDLFGQHGKHRLVMITCGGPFDPRTHRYRDNLVIVANPVG